MATSVFSYAQAAKGQSAVQAATSQQSPNQSQTPSVTGNSSRDANSTNPAARTPSVAVSTSSNDIDSSRSAPSTSTKPEVSRPDSAEVNQDDINTAISVAGSVGSSKTGPDPPSVDGVSKNTESRGRSIHTESDAGEQNENKKGRKTKKGKSTEKDAEAGQEAEKEGPPPKVELYEAPLPVVNIWVQRQQAAKAKIVDQSAGTSAESIQTPLDSKTRSSHNEAAEGNRMPFNGKHGSKRDGEPSRHHTSQGGKRAAPRGARSQEKESDMNLLANNPASWPTPETAAVNLKTQPPAQPEKLEKEDKEDGGAAKPKQKKEWVQLPNFVPSVKFETALPSRGIRGGRAGGSRGGRDAAGNHQATANSTDRPQEGSGGGPRTNSGTKRAPVEASGPREGRKNVPHVDHTKSSRESTSDNTNSEQLKATTPGVANGTSHEQSGQALNSSQHPEESIRNSDSHKDGRGQSNRDAPQGLNGSSHRSGDRARGGGRSRGGFNQTNTNGMPHYSQNAYTAQHHAYPYPPNNSRHIGAGYPPMPYPYAGQPGSAQRRPTNGNRRQGSGRVSTMAPMSVPYDAAIYTSPNGVMFPFDSGNLLQLAQTQVEYYFSVDNCVKDWFLRTHMDSQGFIPIAFIASFNRMRELAVDQNILRQACMDSPVLELVIGGDGVERVRSKEGWEKWVIPDKSLRDSSARHDGPSTWQPFNSGFQPPMMSPHYPVDAPQVFSPTNEHGFAHYLNGNYGMPMNLATVNGVNGHARPQDSQLSAAVPEFSPSTSTFNGLKSAPSNGSENKSGVANPELNGVSLSYKQPNPVPNGVVHQ